jgi:hypothetical protein
MKELFDRVKELFQGMIILFLMGTIAVIAMFLFPNFFHESIYKDLVFSLTLIIVGGFWGSKAVIGQVFGIALCFLGILITVGQIYILWGWLGLGGSLPLAYICINYYLKAYHMKKWVNAPEMFKQAKKHHHNNEKKQLMWECLDRAFIVPSFLKNLTTEIYRHNAMLLAFIVENLSDTLQDEHLEKIKILISYYKTTKDTSKDKPDDLNELTIFVRKLIFSMSEVQQEIKPDSSP